MYILKNICLFCFIYIYRWIERYTCTYVKICTHCICKCKVQHHNIGGRECGMVGVMWGVIREELISPSGEVK